MSSKFFTNRDDNTLENRLKDILSLHTGISQLEFLIGYFCISGFSKISILLENINSARILVGVNINALMLEAKERGKKLNLLDYEKMSQRFVEEQLQELNNEPYEKGVKATDDMDEELQFLEEIREFKEAKPKQFKALQNLPAKIRTAEARENGK